MGHKILVIDEGTSSVRAGVYDNSLNRGDFFQLPVPLYSPSPEIVEQDANLIWQNTLKVAKSAAKGHSISAIGITNQRETSIIWDKKTGQPVHNALVWQDRRGADLGNIMKSDGRENILTQKTGLLADPYFSAFKINWLLNNIDGLKAKAKAGELLFGTVDSWLIWQLTQGQSHATDFSNASRTGLFNIFTQKWDDELLELFDIPKELLPQVLPSNANFGECEFFGKKIPISGVLGDQQAALMGQNCQNPGEAKITFGTGAFLMVQLGNVPKYSNNKMLLTIASKIGKNINYAFEGAVLNAGTTIKFLRDELGIIETAEQSESLALSIPDNNGVYLVPAFTGLGAPYWNADARAIICGMGRGTTRAHFARAAIEASAYQAYDLLEALKKDGAKFDLLRIDGGMAANNFFCQFLADICALRVERPKDLEMTAMGAARIALLGLLGKEAIKQTQTFDVFVPDMAQEARTQNIAGWQKSIRQTLTE